MVLGSLQVLKHQRIKEIKMNLDILDFELSDEEMNDISKLDKDMRYYHRTDAQLEQFAAWKPNFEEK